MLHKRDSVHLPSTRKSREQFNAFTLFLEPIKMEIKQNQFSFIKSVPDLTHLDFSLL